MPLRSLFAALFARRRALPSDLETADAFRAWFLRHVPTHSSVEQGTQFLKEYGFACRNVTNGEFTPQAPPGAGTWRNLSYTYCDYRQAARRFVVRRWQVCLVHRDGRITEIGVSAGLIGP